MGVARFGRMMGRSGPAYDRRTSRRSGVADPQTTAEERAEDERRERVRASQVNVAPAYARIAAAMRLPTERLVTARDDVRYFLLPEHAKVVNAFDIVFWNLSDKGRETIAKRVRKRLAPILAAQALGAPDETIAQMIRQAWKR